MARNGTKKLSATKAAATGSPRRARNKEATSNRGQTLCDYVRAIHEEWCPATGADKEHNALRKWFHWPPNTFLLTSRILSDTGIYRLPVVQGHGAVWPPNGWPRSAKKCAAEWLRWIGGTAKCPNWIVDCIAEIAKHMTRPMQDLFEWQAQAPIGDEAAQREKHLLFNLCRTIVEMHAIADMACCGFGLPSGHMHAKAPRTAFLAYLANTLLITTGTLSTLPRFQGIVLPKMRTPQVGLTLRSLALHLTYNRTEVEVKWRSIPWINRDENTINVLVIPFPYTIRPGAFRSGSHPNFAETLGTVRYFEYSPPAAADDKEESFHAGDVLAYIREARRLVRDVNIVVFPELSLTKKQLREVQILLAKEPGIRVPLIIAGIAGSRSDAATDGMRRLASNEVVLSTHFAGKWYDMQQAKHHRWRLNTGQIEQYQIAGTLAGTQTWWEAIDLPKRQMSCLAPNQWLALCPLICEDLARQEPVYDVIRGIGPTLLMAILLDGPQLKERWSARYASVLADDPGTSVLTLTSYGMAARSQPPGSRVAAPANRPLPVALWKDQKTGYCEVPIQAGDGAAVLTMSAEFLHELTADGRDDDGFASSIVLHGYHTLPRVTSVSAAHSSPSTAGLKTGDPLDIAELSILTHLVDSALDHDQAIVDAMCNIALTEKVTCKSLRFARDLIERIWAARSVPVDEFSRVRPDMEYAVAVFREVMRDVNSGSDQRRRQAKLLEAAEVTRARRPQVTVLGPRQLSAEESRRVYQMVGQSILWALHMRLDMLRRSGQLTQSDSRQLDAIERLLDSDCVEVNLPGDPGPMRNAGAE